MVIASKYMQRIQSKKNWKMASKLSMEFGEASE